jgi:hypothetical protein
MSNLYRGPSKVPSYQVAVHLATVSEEIFFLNQPIRNKNRLWQPCLLTDRDEMSNLYRGPSINAFYQVSIYFAKRFQRGRFFFKSANRKQELPVAAMFVEGSGQKCCLGLFVKMFLAQTVDPGELFDLLIDNWVCDKVSKG